LRKAKLIQGNEESEEKCTQNVNKKD